MIASSFVPSPSTEELRVEILAYRAARMSRLTASTGWLAIINKTWLTDGGAYTVGSAPNADILLPGDRAPAIVGTVTRTGEQIRFDIVPSVHASVQAGPVLSVLMKSNDTPGADPVAIGSLRFDLIHRAGDFAIRVRDTDCAAIRDFSGIPCFDIDPTARVVAQIEPGTARDDVEIPDNDGRNQTFLSPGTAAFVFGGVACRLRLLSDTSGNRLFVVFADATNRDETYGAGRFLYAEPAVNDQVILDFNKAFNPPCAFTSYASCPLPSAENRLAIRIAAGEKRPIAAQT
jgi:uncharacterized protein (DUF1684 family)